MYALVCICMGVYLCIDSYMTACVCNCVHNNYMCVYVCMCVFVYMCVYACVRMWAYVCTYYMGVCACVCVCVCDYT